MVKQFMTIAEAAIEFDRSKATIARTLKEIKSMPDRYDELNYIGSGSKELIRTACLLDYWKYADMLVTYPELAPKYVPSRYEMAFGITREYPTAREIASEILTLIRKE